MKLAIVSDEISPEFLTAVELGTDWGIQNFEIRGLPSGRMPYISERDKREVFRTVKEYGIKISTLSPGAFKIPVDSPEVRSQIDEMLPRTYELAHELGADLVIVFGFLMPEGEKEENYPQQVVDILGEVAEKAERENIRIALENEPSCWAGTGRTSARLVREVGQKNFGLNWDPCNSLNSGGKPYPEEYTDLKDLIFHLHIKDTKKGPEGSRTVAIGEGDVNWQGQLEALYRNGYDGYYTVETHFGPRVKASRTCVENLKRLLLNVM